VKELYAVTIWDLSLKNPTSNDFLKGWERLWLSEVGTDRPLYLSKKDIIRFKENGYTVHHIALEYPNDRNS